MSDIRSLIYNTSFHANYQSAGFQISWVSKHKQKQKKSTHDNTYDM